VHVFANNRQVTVCVAMCFKYRSQRLLPGYFTWRAVWYWRCCMKQHYTVYQC